MSLFGRSRRSGKRKGEDSDRCMECGMTGGEHTDWCPDAPEKDVDVTPDGLDPRSETEGPTESHL